MTGRELIIYILQNGLEDEDVFKDGCLLDFLTESEAADRLDVGVETIKLWYSYGYLRGIRVGKSVFFQKDIIDSKESNEKE